MCECVCEAKFHGTKQKKFKKIKQPTALEGRRALIIIIIIIIIIKTIKNRAKRRSENELVELVRAPSSSFFFRCGFGWLFLFFCVFVVVVVVVWRSERLFGPLALLLDAVEAVAHEDVVGRVDADPARRLVGAPVLQAKGHALVVHLPRHDRLPSELDHLTLRRPGNDEN